MCRKTEQCLRHLRYVYESIHMYKKKSYHVTYVLHSFCLFVNISDLRIRLLNIINI